MKKNEQTKCIFVAIVGVPNAGKSTLTNKLTGSKVSIVSPKVQTTRTRINAIAMLDKTQVVLIDTPGIFTKVKSAAEQEKMHQSMVRSAYSTLKDADLVLVLVDGQRCVCEDTKKIIENVKAAKTKAIAVLNKVDLIKPEKILLLAKEVSGLYEFDKIFMISAQTGNGVKDLAAYFVQNAPLAPFAFPEDDITDAPARFIAAEITREKIFYLFDQEIPYLSAVETEQWKQVGKNITIHQNIYVTRESHKKIIVGKAGAGIKKIGQQARLEMSKVFAAKVSLFLFVKVKPDWMEDKTLAHLV